MVAGCVVVGCDCCGNRGSVLVVLGGWSVSTLSTGDSHYLHMAAIAACGAVVDVGLMDVASGETNHAPIRGHICGRDMGKGPKRRARNEMCLGCGAKNKRCQCQGFQ